MLSFIVVNHNSKNMAYRALHYIENSIQSEPFEIILVDNASKDGSREFFTSLMAQKDNFRYIYSKVNGGFSYANNIGAKHARGDILIFINPDIEIHEYGFDQFIVRNLREEIGVLAPRIIYPNGSLQPNCEAFSTFFTYIFRIFRFGYYVRKFNLVNLFLKLQNYIPLIKKTVVGKYLNNFCICGESERECDWVSGACMIMRKDLFEEIGGFDENFFMYVEDEEFCRRVRDKGYKVVVNYNFTIVHLEGGTQEKNSPILGRAKREYYKSGIYYFYKHKGTVWAYLLKYFYILVQIIASLFYTLFFNFRSAKDRLKFAKELFLYKFGK